VAPSNARATHAGKGIFKSTDAGETFQFMGLEQTPHIAKIIIHPQILVDPLDDNYLYINNISLQSSTDQGKTWDGIP
jgi:hypothetical protein